MSVAPILTLSLRYGGILAGAVAVVAGLIGFLVSGIPGLLGGLAGAVLAALFLGLTTVSMLVAGRVTRGDPGNPVFYAIVLGAWFVKMVVFVVVAVWLRGQEWLNPLVFFVALLVAVIGSLIVDMVAIQRARVPYVSDIELPDGSGAPPRRTAHRPDPRRPRSD